MFVSCLKLSDFSMVRMYKLVYYTPDKTFQIVSDKLRRLPLFLRKGSVSPRFFVSLKLGKLLLWSFCEKYIFVPAKKHSIFSFPCDRVETSCQLSSSISCRV